MVRLAGASESSECNGKDGQGKSFWGAGWGKQGVHYLGKGGEGVRHVEFQGEKDFRKGKYKWKCLSSVKALTKAPTWGIRDQQGARCGYSGTSKGKSKEMRPRRWWCQEWAS